MPSAFVAEHTIAVPAVVVPVAPTGEQYEPAWAVCDGDGAGAGGGGGGGTYATVGGGGAVVVVVGGGTVVVVVVGGGVVLVVVLVTRAGLVVADWLLPESPPLDATATPPKRTTTASVIHAQNGSARHHDLVQITHVTPLRCR